MDTTRQKTGGRQKGTPNRANAQLRAVLDGVFTEAFESELFRAKLLLQIVTLKIDTKLLVRLLEYWAGAPAKHVDVKGKVTLEQIVAGLAVDDDDDAPEAEAEAA